MFKITSKYSTDYTDVFDESVFEAVNQQDVNVTFGEEDSYKLKTDDEIIDMISKFGCGETKFHTADIERMIKELDYLREIVRNS